MKNFSTHLSELFQHAATSAFGITDAVDIAQSTFSDYQCNSALKLGKSLQKNPREVASLLITHLQDPDRLIAKTEIAGPG